MFIKVHRQDGGKKILLNATQIDVIEADKDSDGSIIYLVTQELSEPVYVRESLDEIENALADMAMIAVQPARGEGMYA